MRAAPIALASIALAPVALAACTTTDLGPPEPWTAVDTITGALAPSVGAPPTSAPLTAGGSLRVVTYNIQDGGAPPATLAAAILGDPELARADVVLLQEEEAYPDEGAPRAAALAQLLGMGWFYAPARPNTSGVGTFGDAILSRYPLTGLEVMDLPHASNKLQRTAMRADIQVGATTVRIMTTHLDTTLDITERVQQLHPAVIDEPVQTVLGGDFNTNPYLWEAGDVPIVSETSVVQTDQAPQLDDYLRALQFTNGTASAGPTEVKYGISSRLDAIYARGIAPGAGGVARGVTLSDHWPVWLDLAVP